jgi:N-acyl homoserine lactone hydrolase
MSVMRTKTRLYVLYHGFMGMDRAWQGLSGYASASDHHFVSEWYQAPVFTYLIDHPAAGLIMFDTGLHPGRQGTRIPEEAELFPWTVNPEQHFLASLRGLGRLPGDANYLVISHLHPDHIGNLGLFAGTEAGRSVIIQQSELEHVLYATFRTDSDYAEGFYRPDFAGIPGIAFLPVDGDIELAEGISLLHLPGHTPGSQAMMVRLENTGTVILTADAVYQAPNYGPPPTPHGVLVSRTDWHRSVHKLRILEQRNEAQLLFGHDWDQLGSLRVAPEYYD